MSAKERPGLAGYLFGMADEEVAASRQPLTDLPATDANAQVIAEYLEIPPQFTIILSEGRPRQCRLAWRIGCEFGAQFVD